VEPSLSLPRLFFSLRFCSSCFEYAQPTSPIGPRTACSSPAATPPPELRVVPAPAPESAADCDCGPGFRAGQSRADAGRAASSGHTELLLAAIRWMRRCSPRCCSPPTQIRSRSSPRCWPPTLCLCPGVGRTHRGAGAAAGHRRGATGVGGQRRGYRTDQLLGETDRGSRVRVMMVVVAVHPFGWVR